MVRLVVTDHHDPAISRLLDDLGLLRVRVLGNQRHDAPGEIGLPELRLGDADDLPARRADREQDLSLRI